MRYRLVVQAVDDDGNVSESALADPVAPADGWRCPHAIWPEWAIEPGRTRCDWCQAPLVPCAFVECPWCERYLAADEAVAHWQEGCDG